MLSSTSPKLVVPFDCTKRPTSIRYVKNLSLQLLSASVIKERFDVVNNLGQGGRMVPSYIRDFILNIKSCCGKQFYVGRRLPEGSSSLVHHGKDICFEAVRNGHLACLQYAHQHGCDMREDVCVEAARNGHLACLQYAHQHGCDMREDVCVEAARNGHLACLRYAHQHGCDIRYLCGEIDNVECLKYVVKNGGCEWAKSWLEIVQDNGHLDCYNYYNE